jgi:hypothetical protein
MRALVVRVSEYEPYALWCGASPSAVEPCLLIDKGGVAYTKAVTPDSVYVRYYGVLGGEGLPRQYIEKKDFQKLTALLNEVERTLSPDTLVRVYVDEYNDARAVFKSGFVLVFTLKDESVDVLERFALGLTAEPFNEHVVSEFEYLDLRFGDKLYYKLKVSP